ncbi:ATP synthase F1 subcomplex epsilon subunit [Pseudobutyrivibrio sp. 49]|uniref:ATP synthase F1 subunit epsilon n=1 Tax=unclassified Pseudobutyrivibrio TaxID=2638619 RepID=UPI000885F186|nr:MULTISPECIES: ATP synthase F1 subunit epsilon [unclassified Pseudobutyrivibrio]SDI43018.1 ATP synthase F1 subcomplex epsilon subunit [Pseudobutyrivibrio sp. 49]SFN58983.1 F-type H+-transporting ATPase subunit epsilon [Pseudobutyrivibrio sp. UC1225]
MASLFNLKIIACDGIFYDGPCEILVFPGSDGEYAILNHHEVFTGIVEIGNIRFTTGDGEKRNAIISDGLVTVEPDGSVVIVAYSCERPEDIDTFRAQEALERAQEQLQQRQSRIDYQISTNNMARAMARLKGAGAKNLYKI